MDTTELDLSTSEYAWMLRHAERLVGDRHEAEDLIQDAWLSLVRLPSNPMARRAWLKVVLRNGAYQRFRRAAGCNVPLEDGLSCVESGPLEVCARRDMQSRIAGLVRGMREPYRSMLDLRYYQGLTPTEIASHTGLPLATVKTRLQRGLLEMRSVLQPRKQRGQLWCLALPALAFDGARQAKALDPVGARQWCALFGVAAAALVVISLGLISGGAPATSPIFGLEPSQTVAASDPLLDSTSAQRERERSLERTLAPTLIPRSDPELEPMRRGFRGRVLSADGEPLAGLLVALHGERAAQRVEAVTARDGTYELDLAPLLRRFSESDLMRDLAYTNPLERRGVFDSSAPTLSVAAPKGMGSTCVSYSDLPSGVMEQDFIVSPALPLYVQVIEQDSGRPLIGSKVFVRESELGASDEGVLGYSQASTDMHGRAELWVQDYGPALVGSTATTSHAAASLSAITSAESVIQLEVKPHDTNVQLLAVDSRTGQALSEAIWYDLERPDEPLDAVTGRLEVGDTRPSWIGVRAPGYLPASLPSSLPGAGPDGIQRVPMDPLEEVELVLEPGWPEGAELRWRWHGALGHLTPDKFTDQALKFDEHGRCRAPIGWTADGARVNIVPMLELTVHSAGETAQRLALAGRTLEPGGALRVDLKDVSVDVELRFHPSQAGEGFRIHTTLDCRSGQALLEEGFASGVLDSTGRAEVKLPKKLLCAGLLAVRVGQQERMLHGLDSSSGVKLIFESNLHDPARSISALLVASDGSSNRRAHEAVRYISLSSPTPGSREQLMRVGSDGRIMRLDLEPGLYEITTPGFDHQTLSTGVEGQTIVCPDPFVWSLRLADEGTGRAPDGVGPGSLCVVGPFGFERNFDVMATGDARLPLTFQRPRSITVHLPGYESCTWEPDGAEPKRWMQSLRLQPKPKRRKNRDR